MSPRKKEKKRVTTWTEQETGQLLTSIKAQLRKRDPLPYSRRISVLNWEKITIKNKSIKECKCRLDALIKKIHRTRTLEEILSDLDVEPICGQIVSSPINNNDNSPAISCFKTKPKRSFKVDEKHDSEEHSQNRSHLNPFALFAKHKYSKPGANKNSLNQQYDQLDDGEKLFWIREAVNAVSKDEEVKKILTDDEYVLLQNDLREKSEAIDLEKENSPSNKRKRKLVEDDNATHAVNKKVRKLEIAAVSCATGDKIDIKSTAQEVMGLSERTHRANELDPICSGSASDVEMERNVSEIFFDDNSADELMNGLATYDLATETTEIVQWSSTSISNNSLDKFNLVGGIIEPEDGCKIEEVERFENDNIVKKEVTESPCVFSRIRSMWAGLFGGKK